MGYEANESLKTSRSEKDARGGPTHRLMRIRVPDSSLSGTSSGEILQRGCQSVRLPLTSNTTASPRVAANTLQASPIWQRQQLKVGEGKCYPRYHEVTSKKVLFTVFFICKGEVGSGGRVSHVSRGVEWSNRPDPIWMVTQKLTDSVFFL